MERVWNKAEQIGQKEYTVIVHGKPKHEETRATFSHSRSHTPTVVVEDMEQTHRLAAYIREEIPAEAFYEEFKGQYSEGFDVTKHLQRVGVVNQTTMLASETQAIADYLKQTMRQHYGLTEANIGERFADTRDTLCYATNDNQTAITHMLQTAADLAIVVGGYNSSNTTHLVELCEEKLLTYFINSDEKLLSATDILHYNYHSRQEQLSVNYLPAQSPVRILITSGASCPDATVDEVIRKVLKLVGAERELDKVLGTLN